MKGRIGEPVITGNQKQETLAAGQRHCEAPEAETRGARQSYK